MKGNPQFPINKKMIRNFEDYGGASSKLIGWLEIPIRDFLRLTTITREGMDLLIDTSEKQIYEDTAAELTIPPFLSVGPNGQVMGHEGRHRSASALNTGEKKQVIALLGSQSLYYKEAGLHGHDYWYKDLPFSKTLIGQFNPRIKVSLEGMAFKRRWNEPWEKIMKQKANPKRVRKKRNPEEVVEELSWVDALANHAGEEDRKRIAATNMRALKYYRTKNGKPTPEGRALYKRYSDPKRFRLVGLLTNIRYLQIEEAQGEMEPRYVHPGGSVTLMFLELTPGKRFKYNPVVHAVNVNLRYNDSVINEIDGNENVGTMRGFTF